MGIYVSTSHLDCGNRCFDNFLHDVKFYKRVSISHDEQGGW